MRSFRHQRQSGFTLIELIIVIVIIGILAAVAIPKFADLANDAEQGVMKGIAGSVSSASAINYARASGHLAGSVAVTTAAHLTGLLEIPSGYGVVCSAEPLPTNGTTGPCTITKAGQTAVPFVAYGSLAP